MEFNFCIITSLLSKESQAEIFGIIMELCGQYFRQENRFEFKCMSSLNLLIYQLINIVPYRIRTEEELNKTYTKVRKMRNILSNIESHYTEKLLLSDVPRHEHLSISYLSHFFTENVGLSFQEYLANLRCERARQLILLTSHTLLTISREYGFSDLRYLNQAFLINYGCTPKQYRQNYEKASLSRQQKSMLSTQNLLPRQTCLILLEEYSELN